MAKSNGSNGSRRRLRSQLWFDNPDDPGMTAVYLERYLNFGLTLAQRHRAGRLSASPSRAPTLVPATVTTSIWRIAFVRASAMPAASRWIF